jgi:hypothetical protein
MEFVVIDVTLIPGGESPVEPELGGAAPPAVVSAMPWHEFAGSEQTVKT